MPDSNPFKLLLAALTHRVAVGPIPTINAVYDLAGPVVLIWYWFMLFRDACLARLQGICPARATADRPGWRLSAQ